MNKQVTQLMNFRIPSDLKDDFNFICRIKHTAMTTELLRLIRSYINEEANKQLKHQATIEDLKQLNKPDEKYKKWGSFIYDIKNKKWFTITK